MKKLLDDMQKIYTEIVNNENDKAKRDTAIKLLFYRYSSFFDENKDASSEEIDEKLMQILPKDILLESLSYGMSLGAEEVATFDVAKKVDECCRELDLVL
jgi:hypothetical protein